MPRLLVALFVATAFVRPAHAWADPPSFLRRDVVARATHLAITHAGLEPQSHRDLATRARASGWLPQFSVRVVQGVGAIAAIDTNSLLRTTSNDTFAVDLRATFQLNHVLFHPSEVSLERAESRRSDRRDALEREVIDLLVTMERARVEGTVSEGAVRARARLELLLGIEADALLREP